MIVCDLEDESEVEPTDPLDMGIIRCNSEATRFRLQCIHPPCPLCNQYNCEDGEGVYLGPMPEPEPDPNDDINYYYCYPSCKDEYHIRLNYCEKHWRRPTYIKPEWRLMHMKVKEDLEASLNCR